MHRLLCVPALLLLSLLRLDGQAAASYQYQTAVGPLSNIYDSFRVSINDFSQANEFQGLSSPTAQAVVGGVNLPHGGSASAPQAGIALSGNALASANNTYAVGVFGAGLANFQPSSGNTTGMWGANFVANNCNLVNGCSDTRGFDLFNAYGVEIDLNLFRDSAGGAPSGNANGIWLTGASTAQPTGVANALHIGAMGTFANPPIPWKNGIYLDDGAANTGISVGASGSGNGVGAQPIYLRSRSSGGTNYTSTVTADPFGDLVLVPGGGASVVLEDGSGAPVIQAITGSPDLAQINGTLKFATNNTTGSSSASWGSNCPAVNCTAPYKWIQAVAADGSTVYFPVFK